MSPAVQRDHIFNIDIPFNDDQTAVRKLHLEDDAIVNTLSPSCNGYIYCFLFN